MTITWWQFLVLGMLVLVLPQVVLAYLEYRKR